LEHPVIHGAFMSSPDEAGEGHDQKCEYQKEFKAPFFASFGHHLNVCSQYAYNSQKQGESAHYGDKGEEILAEILQVLLRNKEGDHHDKSGEEGNRHWKLCFHYSFVRYLSLVPSHKGLATYLSF